MKHRIQSSYPHAFSRNVAKFNKSPSRRTRTHSGLFARGQYAVMPFLWHQMKLRHLIVQCGGLQWARMIYSNINASACSVKWHRIAVHSHWLHNSIYMLCTNVGSIRQMELMLCDAHDATALHTHSSIHATLIVTNFDRSAFNARARISRCSHSAVSVCLHVWTAMRCHPARSLVTRSVRLTAPHVFFCVQCHCGCVCVPFRLAHKNSLHISARVIKCFASCP